MTAMVWPGTAPGGTALVGFDRRNGADEAMLCEALSAAHFAHETLLAHDCLAADACALPSNADCRNALVVRCSRAGEERALGHDGLC